VAVCMTIARHNLSAIGLSVEIQNSFSPIQASLSQQVVAVVLSIEVLCHYDKQWSIYVPHIVADHVPYVDNAARSS